MTRRGRHLVALGALGRWVFDGLLCVWPEFKTKTLDCLLGEKEAVLVVDHTNEVVMLVGLAHRVVYRVDDDRPIGLTSAGTYRAVANFANFCYKCYSGLSLRGV